MHVRPRAVRAGGSLKETRFGVLNHSIDCLQGPIDILQSDSQFCGRHSGWELALPWRRRKKLRAALDMPAIARSHLVLSDKVIQCARVRTYRLVQSHKSQQKIGFTIKRRFELCQLLTSDLCFVTYVAKPDSVPRVHLFNCAFLFGQECAQLVSRFNKGPRSSLHSVDEIDRVLGAATLRDKTCSKNCDGCTKRRAQERRRTVWERIGDQRQASNSGADQRPNKKSKQSFCVKCQPLERIPHAPEEHRASPVATEQEPIMQSTHLASNG